MQFTSAADTGPQPAPVGCPLLDYYEYERQDRDRGIGEGLLATDCDSVWLECNGELRDLGSVKFLGVHKSACGFETLHFICPRCKEPHELVRLG